MYENRDQSQSTPGVGAFGGFVVGALLGAGLALLLAPASGGETRRRLGYVARRVTKDAQDRLGQ